MKTKTTQLALSLSLLLGSASMASAASLDYPQTGPVFSDSAYMVGGGGEVDTFYFTNQTAGSYYFYSTGTTDVRGYIYSDTHSMTLASNDDGAGYPNFCVEANLLAGEAISIAVDGWTSSTDGSYGVVGASGTCADSGFSYFDSGLTTPVAVTVTPPADSGGSFSLPLVLFSLLALGAARLRRFFA
ncbi:MAG: hypothetical protein OEY29_00465 [Gammaproteobacteria bacterium]|nr:hypothetical protein [Gammaproteobacteria bacterium]